VRPGVRLDETVPGDGFGLSIAKELTEIYGGSLAFGEAPTGGLRVSIRLPRSSA
jgi:signal transduction histidine kinase